MTYAGYVVRPTRLSEGLAYRHLERSGWLLHHASKALAMHVADEVWTATERHLFGDSEGQRSGMPRVGSWWHFSRIPGRARSHTVERKWETFRLHGTLDGHLAAYRHPELPAAVSTAAEVASAVERQRLARGGSVLVQPWRPRPPGCPASWWEHRGPLVLVFTGGPASRAGEPVLPVRLPQAAHVAVVPRSRRRGAAGSADEWTDVGLPDSRCGPSG